MLRRIGFFSLAIVVVLAGVVSVASAAQNVANTNPEGEPLDFPQNCRVSA